MPQTWREIAKPIIKKVLEETRGATPQEIKRAIKNAYPFAERKSWPYKVWLDEVRRQYHKRPPAKSRPPANQLSLFPEDNIEEL
jgi:hypothetical protein